MPGIPYNTTDLRHKLACRWLGNYKPTITIYYYSAPKLILTLPSYLSGWLHTQPVYRPTSRHASM